MNANTEPIDVNSLEWKLECATVKGWRDLSTCSVPEQIDVEYHTGGEGNLEHLKVWCSMKWNESDLVCDYWLFENGMNHAGTTFSNGFDSAVLARLLDSIMKHQECFPAAVRAPFGLIQVQLPTDEKLLMAERVMAITPAALPPHVRSTRWPVIDILGAGLADMQQVYGRLAVKYAGTAGPNAGPAALLVLTMPSAFGNSRE